MKRSLILFLSTLSLTTTAAFAAGSFNGFYAGVAGGGNQITADTNSNSSASYIGPFVTNPAFPDTLSNSQSSNVKRNTVIGDVYAGWGHQLGQSRFYAADELFYNVSNREVGSTNFAEFIDGAGAIQNNLTTTVTTKLNQTEYGNDVLAGILFGKNKSSLFYTRAGVAFNRLRLNADNTLNITDLTAGTNPTGAIATSALPSEASKSVEGLRLGFGFAKRFSQRLAMHIDYIYTDYGKINAANVGNTNSPFTLGSSSVVTNGFHNAANTDVHTQAVMVGASYYFTPFNPTAILSPIVKAAISSATSAATTTTTTPEIPVHANFGGFYVGASTGATQTMEDLDSLTTATYVQQFTVPNSILKNSLTPDNLRSNDAMGSVDIGFGVQRAPMYIAAEIFSNVGGKREINATHQANYAQIDPTSVPINANLNSTTKVQLNAAEYGIDVLPGFLVGQNMLIYGRAGISFNKLEINNNNTFTFVNNALNPHVTNISTLNTAASKNVEGFRLGVGVAEKINPHFAVHADYIYTDYGRINTSGVGSTTSTDIAGTTNVVPNGFINNASADITSQALMAGVNYYFSPRKII